MLAAGCACAAEGAGHSGGVRMLPASAKAAVDAAGAGAVQSKALASAAESWGSVPFSVQPILCFLTMLLSVADLCCLQTASLVCPS